MEGTTLLFGERLQQNRNNLNLTQQDIADKMHVSRQTISSWERGNSYPDINSLISLSDYYQVSLDVLLKEDTGMKEYLEKKEVVRSLKPIYRSLILAELFLVLLLLCDLFNLVHMDILFTPVLLAVLFIILALNDLNSFNRSQSLGLKYTWQKYLSGDHGLKYALILPTLFTVLGIIVSLKERSVGIPIVVAGIAFFFTTITKKLLTKSK